MNQIYKYSQNKHSIQLTNAQNKRQQMLKRTNSHEGASTADVFIM